MTSTLKATYFIAILFLSSLFVSCDDSDDEIIVDESNLIGGTWTYSGVESESEAVKIVIDAFSDGHELSFSEDNTYTEVAFGFENSGTWTFDNNTLTLDEGDDFEEIYEVNELSESTMKLYIAESTDDEGNSVAAYTLIYNK